MKKLKIFLFLLFKWTTFIAKQTWLQLTTIACNVIKPFQSNQYCNQHVSLWDNFNKNLLQRKGLKSFSAAIIASTA